MTNITDMLYTIMDTIARDNEKPKAIYLDAKQYRQLLEDCYAMTPITPPTPQWCGIPVYKVDTSDAVVDISVVRRFSAAPLLKARPAHQR